MSISDDLIQEMTTWRRTIHAHPETSFEEVSTAKLVARVLREQGIAVHEGLGQTGVVGVLTRGSGPAIGLRADIDALPLVEKNTFAHASKNAGKMHGCGHDGHTAMLLGAAAALSRNTDWAGTVHFIFQPAEEHGGGGKKMLDDGLFERFPCEKVFGMHNWPYAPLGQFLIRPGPMMASSDNFEINVRGKGAHAALPETGVDTLVCACQIVLALQTIISRRIAPRETAVLSVTQVHGGAAMNVLPDDAVIRGTVRCFSKDVQRRIQELMVEISEGIARVNGATATVIYDHAYPVTINAPAETEIALRAAQAVVGASNVIDNCEPAIGSEDFSYMLEQKPGAYIWLGSSEEHTGQDKPAPLHNPFYDFNDHALKFGAAYWVELIKILCPK